MRVGKKANYSYKFRLYPTKEQEQFLKRFIGSVRFVYNYMLARAKEDYQKEGKKWSVYEYKKLLPLLKEEYPFLKEVPSQSLQEAVFNLDRAFKNFFAGRSDFPAFKKKKHGGSFYLPQGWRIERINQKWGLLYLPKLKEPIKVRLHRDIEGGIVSINVRLTPAGSFYLTVRVYREIQKLEPVDKICAIDVGVKHFATICYSDGSVERVENPRYLVKKEKRLAREQRKLSRKQKGSKNYEKQRLKVAKLHEKVKNKREDFLHKLSKRIMSENQAIVLEDLNVNGLLSGNLSKHIQDSSWRKFIHYLSYKALWYGRELIFADRFYPSSKTCHVCGYKNQELKLSNREWICPVCGTKHDRDINAGKNLLLYGVAHLTRGRVGPTRTKACGDVKASVKQELSVVRQEAPQFIEERRSLWIYHW